MGVDVLYSKLEGMDFNGTSIFTAVGTFNGSDVDNLMFRFRVHRDFYP